jgi:hypothetical protein
MRPETMTCLFISVQKTISCGLTPALVLLLAWSLPHLIVVFTEKPPAKVIANGMRGCAAALRQWANPVGVEGEDKEPRAATQTDSCAQIALVAGTAFRRYLSVWPFLLRCCLPPLSCPGALATYPGRASVIRLPGA